MRQVSSRSSALRAGNRSGMLAGMMARGGLRMSRERAILLAGNYADSGLGLLPDRWRPLFVRAFVKAAVAAGSSITVSSKYGVA